MVWQFFVVIFVLSLTYSNSLLVREEDSSDLLVHLTSGSFVGQSSTTNGTERWLGIPFAQPPVGNLRFKAPVAITTPAKGIQNATQFGNACPQLPSATTFGTQGEDCLTLNVWRPIATSGSEKLPTLVWFYGGAYMHGGTADPTFEPTRIIERSTTTNKPIIFVSVNWRVNTFGFLASKHVPLEDLNVGLQDQRAALIFLQDNIARFRGDPEKASAHLYLVHPSLMNVHHSLTSVTQQSAGAGSVEAHILFPAKQPLFRAGIMDSSTGPFKTAPVPAIYDELNQPFSNLLELVGCAEGPGSVECLRDTPFDSEQPALAAHGRPARRLRHGAPVIADR
ncbi:hypothetical protein NM688_g6694 [Phlebia brevispora]|uniref:Uncharacterized protein n=1 Tax=Phlebia brevispora TaxID=194682 RepID=A0ACC1SDI2_9APHY|nr:hypothetical protein NM688_g6694 [Phlebia brevispora]